MIIVINGGWIVLTVGNQENDLEGITTHVCLTQTKRRQKVLNFDFRCDMNS